MYQKQSLIFIHLNFSICWLSDTNDHLLYLRKHTLITKLAFLSVCRTLLPLHVTQSNTHTLPGICLPPGERLLAWKKSLKEVLNKEDAEQEESPALASSQANSQDIRGDHRRHTEEHRGRSQQVEGWGLLSTWVYGNKKV